MKIQSIKTYISGCRNSIKNSYHKLTQETKHSEKNNHITNWLPYSLEKCQGTNLTVCELIDLMTKSL